MFGSEYEEDFIMRQIKDLTGAIAHVVFGADTTAALRQEQKADAFADRLTELAGSGRINEAEDLLYEADPRRPETLCAGLLLYEHLNGLDDAFLAAHDFSRTEIRDGLQRLAELYGLGEVAGLFEEEWR